jgi:hypothetical protein
MMMFVAVSSLMMTTVVTTFAQPTPTIQVIHAAADPALGQVGLWVALPPATPTTPLSFIQAVPSLAFRSTTPALAGIPPVLPSFAPLANQQLTLNITPANSTSATPAALSVTGIRLSPGANIFIARGVQTPSMFAANPNGVSTSLSVVGLTDTVSVPAGQTRLILYHGVTDAPAVDLYFREFNLVAVANIRFDQFSVFTVPTGEYTIDVRAAGTTTVVGSFRASVQTWNASGQRVVLAATGFLNPSANRNGAAFGLTAYTPSGQSFNLPTVPPLPPPSMQPDVSFQAIHASADPSASPISAWLGIPLVQLGTTSFVRAAPVLTFRTGTPRFASLTIGTAAAPLSTLRGVPLALNLTATTNTMETPAVQRFSGLVLSTGANIYIAHGVLVPTEFLPNPEGKNTLFTLSNIIDTLSSIAADRSQLLVFHACTDAPRVEFVLRGIGLLGVGVGYGEGFLLSAPVNDYIVDVRVAGTTQVVASYQLSLRSNNWGGKRVSVIATGFLNPARNRNGAAFGLLATLNDENGSSILLPTATPVSVQNTFKQQELFSIAPNPARFEASLNYTLESPGIVEMSAFNTLGQRIWTLAGTYHEAGTYALPVNVSSWASGTYTVQLRVNNLRTLSTTMVISR